MASATCAASYHVPYWLAYSEARGNSLMTTKRILIVDDEVAITSGLVSLFKQAGYNTTVARGGNEAISLLIERPDLVILDIRLPDIDGYAVCRHIRQALDYLPIVMLSAKAEVSDQVAGLELGADLYLTKPFEPSSLLAQVRALLRLVDKNSSLRQNASLICGELWMCESQHRVELTGKLLALRPKEFKLLRCLMRRPGQVFGRETLLREVWGYEYSGDTRTVDVHIQRLRRKIEVDPSDPRYLVTVRGFGYCLAAFNE